MAATADPEIQKAFEELRTSVVQNEKEVYIIRSQIMQAEKKIKENTAISNILKSQGLSNDTKVYNSIGRMFLQTTVPKIMSNFETSSKENSEKVKNLKAKEEVLKKQAASKKAEVMELIQKKRDS